MVRTLMGYRRTKEGATPDRGSSIIKGTEMKNMNYVKEAQPVV